MLVLRSSCKCSPLLTSCFVAWFLTGHRLVPVLKPVTQFCTPYEPFPCNLFEFNLHYWHFCFRSLLIPNCCFLFYVVFFHEFGVRREGPFTSTYFIIFIKRVSSNLNQISFHCFFFTSPLIIFIGLYFYIHNFPS